MLSLRKFSNDSRKTNTKVIAPTDCVNNTILEYDWLLTAVIYGLIGCFMVQTVRFDLSNYKHL